MVVRIGLARVRELGRDDVDRQPVFGVHHDQPAVLRGLLQRAEDRPVVAEEDAGVGREQLEVGDTLRDEGIHLRQRLVIDVRHDHVEAVVGDRVAFGLGMPGVEALAQGLAARLHGEVDDRRRPAEGRRSRTGLEGVLREGAAEGQFHMGMHVDRAGNEVFAAGVDGLVGGHPRGGQVAADQRDLLAVDQHVRAGRALGRDHDAVGDQGAHHAPLEWICHEASLRVRIR